MAKEWQKTLDALTSGTYTDSQSTRSPASSSGKAPSSTSNSWQRTLDDFSGSSSRKKQYDDAIAPVASRVITRATKKKEEEEKKKRKWFEKGHFEDGYQIGDITKTILGIDEDTASLKDLTVGSVKRGYYNSIYGEESFKAMNGGQNKKDEYAQILAGDEYQFTPGNSAAGAVSGAMELLGQQFRQFTNPSTLALAGTAATMAGIAGQAGPQVLAPEEVITVPAAAMAGFTAGSAKSNLEIEAGHAYNEMLEAGITEETARKVATTVGAVNASLEILQVDELLDAYKATKASGATKTFAKKIFDELIDRGVDVAKETVQEVAQEGVTMAGVQYASQKDKGEDAFTADEAKDRLKDTAKSSALSFGLMNAPAAVKNTVSIASEQQKANSLTKNEQAVVDKVVADRVAEAEKDGTKLSNSEKKKITQAVVADMENGDISVDTIEEVLGGDSYKAYRETVDKENAIIKEFEELGEKQNATLKDQTRYTELTEQVKDIYKNSQRKELRTKLNEQMLSVLQHDRLQESYREHGNSRKAFEADVSQYSEKQRVIVQKALDAKTADGKPLLSNSRHTHTFVDFVAKISEDIGVDFDFADTKRLQEAGFALEGQTIDGFYNPKESKVTLNLNSPKSRQFVVGHEITHALEGTDLYDALRKSVFDYAKMKNQYDARMESIRQRYKEGTDFESELTADLVGEYIFSDTDFINNLSTQNRNVFQKVFDEIKYLYKIATAGSKEAKELERVKRAFEKAYRETDVTATRSHDMPTEQTNVTQPIKQPESVPVKAEAKVPVKAEKAPVKAEKAPVVENPKTKKTAPVQEQKTENIAPVTQTPKVQQPIPQPQPVQQTQQQKTEQKEAPKKGKKIYFHFDSISNSPYFNENQDMSREDLNFSINDDNSIDLDTTGEDDFYNSLSGWMENKGLGKLYNVYADGQLVTNPKAVRGVYSLADAEVTARPVLKKLDGGNLIPQQKGEIHFYSADFDKTQPAPAQQNQQVPAVQRTAQTTIPTQTPAQIELARVDAELNSAMAKRQEISTKIAQAEKEFADINKQFGYKPDFTRPLDPDKLNEAHLVRGSGNNNMPPSLNGHRPESDIGKALFQIARFPEKYGGRRIPYNESKQYLSRSGVVADAIIPLRDDIHVMFGSPTSTSGYDSVHYQKDAYNVVPSVIGENNKMIFDGNGLPYRPYDSFDRNPREYFGMSKSELAQLPIIQKARSDYNEQLKEDGNISNALYRLGDRTPEYIDATRPLYDKSVSLEQEDLQNQEIIARLEEEKQALQQKNADAITYDDAGNVIPLSERFNAEKKDLRYSLSEVTEEQKQKGLDRRSEVTYSLSNDTAYMDKAIAKNNSMMNVDTIVLEETKALRERIAGRMNDIKDRGLVGLPEDIEGNTYIANSSYDGTEENTTICPRSLASEAFVDAVSEYLGRPLSVEEQIYISQDLQGRSLTPECTYCYVATDRKAYRAFLGEYVAQRDAVLQKVQDNPNADVSRSGELYKQFLNGRKDTNPMYSRFKMWVDAYKNGKPMIDASHLANINKLMGDINAEFGAELKPQIVDAMKYAQSASWAKKRVNYVAYNGHILNWKQDRINKLNSHYGLRMYSFSDFHPAFVLENMQMITDASVRGLKMLGYTKDTDFVDIFAPSGMNINISTFGFEASGEVFENNLIGAEWQKAKELREQYPNVGITFVATNDTLVEWALDQDWIDVVIPFHLVRTGKDVAKAFNYHDYTSESSDVKTKDWKKGDKKYIAPTEHNNDKATYLAALAKNHLKPRFERFIDNPNYMKLVNECRQPASMSKPVQPVFNEDAAMVALAKLEANGYYQPIGGSVDRMYEIAGEVAEAMTKELAPSMSLSNAGEQHTPDSLSALRLQTDDFAPVAENATVSKTESVQDAPIYESNDKSAPEGQTTMFEPEETPKKVTRKEYHQSIIDRVKATFKAKGFDLDNVLKNARNLSTWSTVDNTPQRVMEKALGYKEGGILADITVNKVAQNETEGIKWLNSYVDQLKQISKQYGIKPGSKESAAAQMYAEGFYVNEDNEIIRYGDPELIQDFGNADVRRRIKALARDPRIRKIYDETLAKINESRARNLYPEIPRLDNYFLHFRAMEDTFSTLGLPFNPNDIRAKDLPTDLNGVTADLKPGQPYFASANHRTGKRTSFDLLGGVERYLNSAKNQIYHIDDIQTLRALRNYVAETYGQATGLEDIDTMSDAEAEERIKQVYGSHLSTFAKFLNEEANVLAGKTALIDRGIEGIIGRRGITFLNALNKQVGSNMVGYNISSSLTNFLPVVQTFAKTNKFDFTKAFAQTVANKLTGGRFDSFAEDSPVVIRRKGEDRFYRTPWQKMADPGYALMGMVDDISTEIIARTKYNEFTRKGMDSQKAHFETDKWVSRLMGDRSLGQQPQLYNSKMLGLVTKFQLEVRNQLDSQFYDTIQETKVSNEHIKNGLARNAKTAAKVASVFAQLAVAQNLYGMAFESMAGYNPAFDIIEVLMTAFGFDDEEDSEDTLKDNLEQGFEALMEDLPYASIITGGGRIPVSSALPIKEFFKGEDQYGNEKSRWETLGEVAPYYLMPGGYGQLKKTTQGLKMFSDDHPIAGSYTDAGNLRFNVEDTVGSRIKAGIFGQYASENAQKYFDQEQSTLNPEQTEIFAGLDIPIEEYWKYRDNLYAFYDVRDQLKDAAYADGATDEDVLRYTYINNIYGDIYDLYDKQKEIAGGNSLNKTDELRKLQKQMEQMLSESKYGVDSVKLSGAYAEVGGVRYNKDADSGKWYEIKPKNADGSDNWYYQKEQEVTKGLGISYEEYWNNREEYNYAYDKPGRYAIAQAVGGYDSYREYYDALENWQSDSYIASDKDAQGNSINGSRKKKVLDYINGLNLDYGERIILYRTVYSSKSDKRTYNQQIIDYLNERDDISYQQMEMILEELGMEVDANGNITW